MLEQFTKFIQLCWLKNPFGQDMELVGRTIQEKHLIGLQVMSKGLPGRFGSSNAVVQPNAFLIGFDFVFFPVTRIFEKLAANESATVASEPNPKRQLSKNCRILLSQRIRTCLNNED